MITDIAFSIYAVTDISRARAFYEGVLGFVPNQTVSEQSPWIEYNIGSSTLAIGSSPEWKPSPNGAAVALETEDFPAAVKVLQDHNVPFFFSNHKTIQRAIWPLSRIRMAIN